MLRKSGEHARQFLFGGDRYKREVKKQIRFLVLVTLGFTIAFTWRQTVFDLFQEIILYIFPIKDSALSSIVTSTFITIVSGGFVLVTSYFLQEKE